MFDKIDAIAVGLLALAIVPWFIAYISCISIAGVFEAELRNIKREMRQTRQEAESASTIARRSQDTMLFTAGDGAATAREESSPDRLMELANEYAGMRQKMESGPARTAAMTGAFSRMLREAASMDPGWKELDNWLRSDDGERQLGAIAYLYAHPSGADVGSLVDTVQRAKQPFVQYWALRAIHSAVDAGAQFSLTDVERPQRLEQTIQPGTDRFILSSSINRAIRNRRGDHA